MAARSKESSRIEFELGSTGVGLKGRMARMMRKERIRDSGCRDCGGNRVAYMRHLSGNLHDKNYYKNNKLLDQNYQTKPLGY